MTTPVPDADAAEQQQPVVPDEPGSELPAELPLEADPADAAEQAVAVPLDDDEGRD
jgi:hypothetical protein